MDGMEPVDSNIIIDSLHKKVNEQESTIINLRADVALLTEIVRDLEGKNRGLENSRNFIMNVLKQ
jgi:uncharacterized coiled-coil protein SlyX